MYDWKITYMYINKYGYMLTDKKAWIKSAFTLANGFPLTRTVNVSSFSVVIRLPNHDLFVNSGEDSGVRWTLEEKGKNSNSILLIENSKGWNRIGIDKRKRFGIRKFLTSSVLVSNLRRWNLGLPRKEFFNVVNRDLQW